MKKKLLLVPHSLTTDLEFTAHDIRTLLFIIGRANEEGILKCNPLIFVKRNWFEQSAFMESTRLLSSKGYIKISDPIDSIITIELTPSAFIDSPTSAVEKKVAGYNSPSPNDIILLLRSSICICPSPISFFHKLKRLNKEEGNTLKRQPREVKSITAVKSVCTTRKSRLVKYVPTPLSDTKIDYGKINVPIPTKCEQEIINKWNSCKEIRKFYIRDTNVYRITIDYIKKLKSGNLFKKDVKLKNFVKTYTLDEILKTLDNFHLALKNPRKYKLTNNDIFRLKKCILSEFLYNNYNPFKSEFVRFLDKTLYDKHKEVTRVFTRFYINKVLGGIDPGEFSWQEKIKFMEASEKCFEFYTKNKRKMRSSVTGGSSLKAFARVICEAIQADCNDISQVSPGWFCSDITFNRRLPAHLNKQGALMIDIKKEKLPIHI